MGSVIVDYNSGNIHSVKKSFQLIANELGQEEVLVSNNPKTILKAEKIVLPGVGTFTDCKSNLVKQTGLIESIEQRVVNDGIPFLGICVGHQLLASIGLENNVETSGLGWIPGTVTKISSPDPNLKIPHMGWNTLIFDRQHELFDGIKELDHAYFVHSYHVVLDNPGDRVCYTNYGQKVTAAVVKENIVGTQFHPEKSQAVGLTFIQNFMLWKP